MVSSLQLRVGRMTFLDNLKEYTSLEAELSSIRMCLVVTIPIFLNLLPTPYRQIVAKLTSFIFGESHFSIICPVVVIIGLLNPSKPFGERYGVISPSQPETSILGRMTYCDALGLRLFKNIVAKSLALIEN